MSKKPATSTPAPNAKALVAAQKGIKGGRYVVSGNQVKSVKNASETAPEEKA
ncbi:hypothetical protein [Alteromonas sp. KUL49]|uniref:hypothetical protein n=1 Tax=Alteromonas sp. KUL49 TaxID=2480798 RepID=UPI0010FFBAD6|nr:hypothetical protein [Alteromonas sp. KUL49]GEA12682.1 hypothetical protein KUL49_30570 [Alteromonas sp. KUL49]